MNALETDVLNAIGDMSKEERIKFISREKSKRWAKNNPGKVIEINRNKKEYKKEWEIKNIEKVRQQRKTRYQKNKATIKERFIKFRNDHIEEYRRRRLQYTRNRRAKFHSWWNEYKSSLKCFRCGESRAACLDFHHLNPIDKDMHISTVASGGGTSMEKILKELEKCIVLCANCHRMEHSNGK